MGPSPFDATDRLTRHYAHRARQILDAFADVRTLIQHEASKGQRVEREVRKFLVQFLPGIYEYTSGIVIDNSGGECDRSKQEDVLVVDRLFNPKLFLDEEPSVYPVDIVYAGIEVKTCLDLGETQSAVANIASLKGMKYIQQRVASTDKTGLRVSRTSAPIGIIFAFDSDTHVVETLLERVSTSVRGYPRQQWPDLVCVINRGIIGFTDGNRATYGLFGALGTDPGGQIAEVMPTEPCKSCVWDGRDCPVVESDGKHYVVDVGRTMIGFLTHFYHFLLDKALLARQNLLDLYVPQLMRRTKTFQQP
ncbi:MAG: hypothetical protein KKI02_01530 [Planctomycetes bacterium]|nr:hypothetical protein [Planctomycetota bacterium]